jgi:hypothetical protein
MGLLNWCSSDPMLEQYDIEFTQNSSI